MFQKVLIANRGEIAVRVIRACRGMGIKSVAVYSDADKDALHAKLADEAIHIGPAPSAQSYLVQESIIAAAKETGAEAIHPGYGFLSENADFARAVAKAGLIFIGPTAEAMDQMGDKVAARTNAVKAGVPVAPGSEALRDGAHAAEEAKRIGYPVMLKASAGGGGIGMRIVRDPAKIMTEFDSCQAQASSAFGVPDVFMEKFIQRPRHIEVQILADNHGNVIHLFERECSVQRRNQKLVEEAPSPALTQEEREDLGAKAVALAKLVGYQNAGTLEFLYEDGEFYFNEMNTRLQVEHPVTEMVTGVDLVAWQLRIAAGDKLTLKQSDIKLNGHAFEARINAEDPHEDFRPSPGTVAKLTLPSGQGIRTDVGLYEGWTVPAVYDSMVMKLLTHAPTRDENCQRMLGALAALEIGGFTTNQAFHEALFDHPTFQAGDLTTRFLEEHDVLNQRSTLSEKETIAALALAIHQSGGGGLAGAQLAQRIPPLISTGARRSWESA